MIFFKRFIFFFINWGLSITLLFSQSPAIASFTPSSGSIGTVITILGTNLNNADTIKIGGAPAIKISNTSTKIVVIVMPESTNSTIYVKNFLGSVSSDSIFTVTQAHFPTMQQGNKLVGSGSIGGNISQGNSVSISADGNTAIVGGYGDDNNQGAAWIYVRNGSSWIQQGLKLVGTGNIGAARQGISVAISGDGNTAIVGGYGDNNDQGAAWIYVRNGSSWIQQGLKLVGTGNIGAARQGMSVAISADGNTAIVGGSGDNIGIGATWVFARNGSIWTQQGNKLTGTGVVGGYSNQGKAVAISANGNTIIIGGYGDNNGQGAAWIFVRNGSIWTQQGNKLFGIGAAGSSLQGIAVAISANGNTVIIGGYADSNNYGAAWIFNRIGSIWSQQGNKLVATNNGGFANQGCSVSISADGNIALVGGLYDNSNGAVWVFKRSLSFWSQVGTKLVGTGFVRGACQGCAVSLSADGNTCISGGECDNSSLGSAWIFQTSDNSKLSDLSVNIGNIDPNFDENTTLYVDTVNYNISSLKITPTSQNPLSNIQYRLNNGTYSPILSGSLSPLLSLNFGTNTIELKVTAQNEVNTSLYILKIVRVPDPLLISSFTPLSGSPGSLVTILGAGLRNPTSLKIGGVTALIISNIGTKIVAMVMPGANTGAIKIANDSDSLVSTASFSILPNLPPGGQQGGKLVGSGGIGSNISQGNKVGISADGITAIVGGYQDNNPRGAAWIYTRNGNQWNQQGSKLYGTGSTGDAHQGISVAISADGNTAILGGYQDNSNTGAVWVFKRTNNVWSQQGSKLVGSISSFSSPSQGLSVALSADGNTAIVGGSHDSASYGAAWVFKRTNNIWSQQGSKLVGSGSIGNSYQGCSVSLSADGNTAIVGGDQDSSGKGAVWIFTRSNNIWSQQGSKLVGSGSIGNSYQGCSVALSADGNTAIVGGSHDSASYGAAWVFKRTNNIWSQQGSKLVGSGSIGNSYQGCSVSLSADGNTAIVGGYGDNNFQGASWIYLRNGSSWIQQGSKLVGTGNIGNSRQGGSVSLSADGNTAISGGPGDSADYGAVWIFTNPKININDTNLVFTNCFGNTSVVKNVIVSAVNISNTLLITAPVGFEVSTSISSGYNSSISILPKSGLVKDTIIYIRLAPLQAGTYFGSITFSSINADFKTIGVSGTIYTKPLVGFTTNTANQCLNTNSYSFADTSKISSGAMFRLWTLGNGDTTSTINPSKVFSNAGTYNIKLLATSDNGCKDSLTKSVIVYPNTKIGFNINNATQCVNGNSFLYTDTSNISTGTFTRLWNFGDASTSTTNPFTKTYSNASTYQVKLLTTSNFGCKDSIAKTVTVNPKPLLGFTTNTANQCVNTNNYLFADTTKIASGTINRLWTLGNGDTTSLISPSKVFSNAGTYNIKLLATSDNGCKDSLTKSVIVYPNTKIGFNINNATQCVNGNSFLYTDTSIISSGTFTRLWNFGDASTSTTNPFTKTYSNASTYQVKLLTTSNFGCKDSITKTVTVNPKPLLGFTTNTANQCVNTNSYVFADTTIIASGTLSRLWTLGNGDTTSFINPSKVFSNAGTYNIKLLATSDNGCKDSLTKSVIVYPNTNIGFKVNTAAQCINGNSFLYTDTSNISTGTFTRLWNFGDASAATTSPFTKTYSNANTYQVKLVTTSNNACKDSITKIVTVNPKPDVYFMNTNPSQCLKGNLFSFPDSSFIASGSLNRTWYLGDGSIDTNLVANKSYTQAKTYQVKLVVTSNNACQDSMISEVIVHPQPISVATAQGRTIICPNEMVNIKASSANGNTYQWLKNEVPLSSSRDSILQISEQGIYKVITTTAFACIDTSQGVSIVVNPLPKANFGINNAAQCMAGNLFQFVDSSTLASGSLHRIWYLNNVLSDTTFSINKSYNAAGNYSVKLVALSETNCKDSITKTITVHPQPTPDFTINNPSQCLVPNSFVFTDVSSIVSGSTTRTWYIGNGINATTAIATQVFNSVGNRTVKLVSKSDKACSDSISKAITVNANPVAGVMLGQTTNVAPITPYIYTVAQQLNHTYLWSVTNGIVVAGQGTNAVTVQWIGIGSGKIQAIITNPQGCNDTSSLTLSVTNVGIKELQSLSQLELYPNPNNGDFTLKITSAKASETRISLLNLLGQEVWADSRTLGAGTQEIDLNTNVAAGVYVMSLQNEDGQVLKRVVVR
jgi:PKD repeat protein